MRQFIEGIAEFTWLLVNLLVDILAQIVEALFSGFGLPLTGAQSQTGGIILSAILLAFIVRKYFWGKLKSGEPMSITLKTDKTPRQLVMTDLNVIFKRAMLFAIAAIVVYGLLVSP